jgi:hypothetical protein
VSKKAAKGAAAASAPSVSLAAHPRARVAVRRLRARCGIAGFLLVAFLSHRAGVPGADCLLRGLLGGVVAYFGAWACAVTVYRQLVLAELRHAEQAWRDRHRARVEEAARRNAERAAAS